MKNEDISSTFNSYKNNVMHLCKEFHISDDIIFATDYILLTQFSTLCKNDIDFIKEIHENFKTVSAEFKLDIYSLLLLLICSFRE